MFEKRWLEFDKVHDLIQTIWSLPTKGRDAAKVLSQVEKTAEDLD